ncbi:hypothetical protein DRP05_10620 [Archaeoglobales archaeon]|nr:MAG: hypothetical protein DRO97_06340 [Archaeoglobales archaeon]RLI77301.1 MAG: hypothetical protein DRP05_10620 [Archaeoglobales archaeon]
MSRLFNRYYELHIANKVLTIDDFDIFFRVKGKANEAATAEITIFNLSEATRQEIKAGSPLVLIAGYRDDYGVVFQGTVKRAEMTIEGADVATEIIAVDNLADLKKKIKITVPEGTDFADIAKRVFQQAGIAIGKIDSTNYSIKRPLTFSDAGLLVLSQLAEETGYTYFVQDGKAYFVKKDNIIEQIILNSETGLLEVTRVEDENEEQQEKYKVKSLLIWKGKLDTRIKLESIKISGRFKVVAYEHACMQDEYYSEFEVVPV